MPSAVVILLVLGAALALAWLSYGMLERLLPQAWLPALSRAVAWFTLGLLLFNPGCPVTGDAARPLVLLDGSLSMQAAGAQWDRALREARDAGAVRLFGDPEVVLDTVPKAGQSRLAPALEAAGAAGRPVVIITDGEIHDAQALPQATVRAATVRVLPRAPGPAAAVTAVVGRTRVTVRDTVTLDVELRTTGWDGARNVGLVVRRNDDVLARGTVQIPAEGTARVTLSLPPGRLPPGDHVLHVGLADPIDREPRDDARLHLVSVSGSPGIVLVAAPGDWEGRFLYRALRDVTDLPVEGYVQLEAGAWRRFADLTPVDPDAVRRALARADLAVFRGATPTEPAGLRAVLRWPRREDADGADWYVAVGSGPVATALAGLPVDSFPPAVALARIPVPDRGWVGVTAQAGRRGEARPVLVGWSEEGRRVVTIGAEGLWRWAFRGGSSEQGYRALLAGTVDWLLAAPDTVRGRARALQPVVPRGLPMVFGWVGGGPPEPVAVTFEEPEGIVTADTLHFDGAGRAYVRLPPGVYRYSLDGGGRGTVAVEEWSAEWFPAPVTLQEHASAVAPAVQRQGIRERLWLFGLIVLALSVEWLARRRRGLR